MHGDGKAKNLHVLFLSIYHPCEVASGPGAHLRYLSEELLKLGCEVHILTPEYNTSEVLDGVQIHTFKSSKSIPLGDGMFFSFSSFRRIDELCKEYKIDIIHGQSPSSVGYACLRRSKLPFVVTVHSTPFGEISSFLKTPFSAISPYITLRSFILQYLLALFASIECNAADRVIAVSKSLAVEAANFYNLPTNKVVTIYNGVNSPDDTEMEERNSGHTILFVGRLVQQKGLEYLIRAMPKILKRFPSARLQMAGGGSYKKYLESLARKLEIACSLDFFGKVPRKRLCSLYANASVVVQPSVYESCGIPVLEAMSMKKPVIGANTGGIAELIKNKENGLLVEPGNSEQLANAIITILSDPSYAMKLGENGRSTVVNRFAWKKIAIQTLELYRQVCETATNNRK